MPVAAATHSGDDPWREGWDPTGFDFRVEPAALGRALDLQPPDEQPELVRIARQPQDVFHTRPGVKFQGVKLMRNFLQFAAREPPEGDAA